MTQIVPQGPAPAPAAPSSVDMAQAMAEALEAQPEIAEVVAQLGAQAKLAKKQVSSLPTFVLETLVPLFVKGLKVVAFKLNEHEDAMDDLAQGQGGGMSPEELAFVAQAIDQAVKVFDTLMAQLQMDDVGRATLEQTKATLVAAHGIVLDYLDDGEDEGEDGEDDEDDPAAAIADAGQGSAG